MSASTKHHRLADVSEDRGMILSQPLKYKCKCGGDILLCYNRPKYGKCEPIAVEIIKRYTECQLRLSFE